jgi:hypothetical protein
VFPIPDGGQGGQSNDQQNEALASAERSFDAGPSLNPSQYRANLVAKAIGELNIIKPQLFLPSDYDQLRGEHPDYFTFDVTEANSDLRTLLLTSRRIASTSGLRLRSSPRALERLWRKSRKIVASFKPAEFRQSPKLGS